MGNGGQYGQGVDGYRWFSNLNGLLNEGQVFSIPVKDLIKGLHTIYFSVLDGKGLEIQRMRSVVCLRPGEVRTCAGCHESRVSAPPNRAAHAGPPRLPLLIAG